MIRSCIRKAMIGAALVAIAVSVLAGTAALAADDGTVLVGVNADRGPQHARALVIRYNNAPYVGPPGQLPDDPPAKKQSVPVAVVEKSNVRGVVEISRMIEITRSYAQVATILQQQSDMRNSAIDKLAEVPA